MLFSSRSQHEPAVVDVNCIHKYKEKFVILQLIGIIIIEGRETRAVIYIQLHILDYLIPNSVHLLFAEL